MFSLTNEPIRSTKQKCYDLLLISHTYRTSNLRISKKL